MIRPFYVAALVLGSLHAASTAQAGTFDDCMRKLGLCYSAGYHSGTPGPAHVTPAEAKAAIPQIHRLLIMRVLPM